MKLNSKLTNKQLQEMGVLLHNITRPKQFYIVIGTTLLDITLDSNRTIKDVFTAISEAASQKGISEGKALRSAEIRDILNVSWEVRDIISQEVGRGDLQ